MRREWAAWKASKEAFVASHSGTSLTETLAACAVTPLGIQLRLLLSTDSRRWKVLFVEWMTVVLPLILCITSVVSAYSICIGLCVALRIMWGRQRGASASTTRVCVQETRISRCALALATALCILGVDFRAFPRRFAKTEERGFSLMDVGTGCIAASNAVNQRRRRRTKWMWLVALGVCRMVVIKAIGYPEHVSEYGAYWNFFFTLAVLDCCPRQRWLAVCTVVLLAWWWCRGPPEWPGGVVSLPGYIAIHCLASTQRWQLGLLAVASLTGASRQRADIGYVCFALGTHALGVCLTSARQTQAWEQLPASISLLTTVDRHHTLFFVLANVGTGIYNVVVDSLAIRWRVSVVLTLSVYVMSVYGGVQGGAWLITKVRIANRLPRDGTSGKCR